MKSSFSPTEPTVIVGKPEIFFVQPARLRSEPVSGNSGSQKRRWSNETCPRPRGERRQENLDFLRVLRELDRKILLLPLREGGKIGKSGPTAARTASTISTANRSRFSSGPPYVSLRAFVPSQKN